MPNRHYFRTLLEKMRKYFFFCTLSFFCFLLLYHHKPGKFNEKKLDQIDIGMTLNQVQEILGCPPGDYSTQKDNINDYWGGFFLRWDYLIYWKNDSVKIGIRLDDKEKVIGLYVSKFNHSCPFIRRIRAWFELFCKRPPNAAPPPQGSLR